MTKPDLSKMTVDQLLDRFVSICLKQHAALNDDDTATHNRLFKHTTAIKEELKKRGPEARLQLTRLYDHPNPWVRYKAAMATYRLTPETARPVLEAIYASKMPPEYLDAGMSLAALDNGTSMLD